MGDVLQIRVSASTYDERDVTRRWPRATTLAWGDREPVGPRGVLELVETLADVIEFADVPFTDDAARSNVSDALALTTRKKQQLEAHLADWQASEANAASYALEEALDDVEKAVAQGISTDS